MSWLKKAFTLSLARKFGRMEILVELRNSDTYNVEADGIPNILFIMVTVS